MKLITAIVRPEKVMDVIKALEQEGYFAFSKWAISGRGKEKGIQVGDVLYQEMAKNMLYITVGDKEKDEVVDIIINSAKSGSMDIMVMEKFLFPISVRHIRSVKKPEKMMMNDMIDEAGGYIWVKEIKEQN